MEWPDFYACADLTSLSSGRFSLRPIRWDDREPIRLWRNAQLDVLRQTNLLTREQQDRYFEDLVLPQMTQSEPDQVLVAYLENDRLIGYGGVVHISWPNRRGEISFMTEPERLDQSTFRSDWLTFLDLITRVASERLGLHRLSTETFAIRPELLDILDSAGFEREGLLREHAVIGERYVDSIIHGLLLSAFSHPRVTSAL